MTFHEKNKIYFIAEFNTSHFGDIDTAKTMVLEAKKAGLDCVKFQSWTAETLYSKTYYDANPIAKRFVKKYSLDESELNELAIFCNHQEIDFLSTPYSKAEVDFLLEQCGAGAVKIASMEINNLGYLKQIASKQCKVYLSTGMAGLDEIRSAVSTLEQNGSGPICIFHCVSQYPTALEYADIANVAMLRNEFPELTIGYSDHTLGFEAPMAAVALGATVIERHFTLDKTKIGMDNNMASEPEEFRSLIRKCRDIKLSLGNYDRVLTEADMAQRANMRRSVVYKKSFPVDHELSASDFDFKRPGTGIPPTDLRMLIGRKLVNNVQGDTLAQPADVGL